MSKIICWPESQMLFDKKGFKSNCELINSEKGVEKYGSSAYLVDEDWYEDMITDNLSEYEDDYEDELSINYDFY